MKEQPDAGIAPQFAALRRPAWFPETEAGDGAPTDSKFAGTPYLGDGGQWPLCPDCRRPIQLFLQLNLGELPEAARGEFGEGLLQFFHCTYPDTSCDQFYKLSPHFSTGMIIRLLPADGGALTQAAVAPEPEAADPAPAAGSAEQQPPTQTVGWLGAAKDALLRLLWPQGSASKQYAGGHDVLPPRRIVGWREVYEYPEYWEAAELLGRELSYDEEGAQDAAGPHGGDKLGGWPAWVQEMDYPDCPLCGRRMRLVFQLASKQNLDFIFGDVGTGHVTQCPEHKEVMGFHWAST